MPWLILYFSEEYTACYAGIHSLNMRSPIKRSPYRFVFTPFMVAFSFSLIGMTRHFSPFMTCA